MTHILLLLTEYKYLILFPIAVLEGPFTAILVGFLASVNIFNIFLAYVVLVFGDMVGDSFYYALGRLGGHFIMKHGMRIGISPEKLENAKNYFSNYHDRALIISKLAYGVGISGLVVAGILKISYKKFIKTCTYIALIQSAFLLFIGFLFGSAYAQIGKYLNDYAKIASAIVLIFLGYLIFSKIKKSIRIPKE